MAHPSDILGLPRAANGALLATLNPPVMDKLGFSRTTTGHLGVTEAAGTWQEGFLRDPEGRLCIVQSGTGTWQRGFLRDAAGLLVTAVTTPTQVVNGLPRDADGRLCLEFAA